MKLKKAFSLIELSIVILVVGILIAGITQSSSLYQKFKLQTGINLTKSSPVAGIKDLSLWLETTLPESFIASEITSSGNNISTWNDISPQNNNKYKATQTITDPTSYQPQYVENIVNGLAVVRFDETKSSYMNSNYHFDVAFDKTVFVVVTNRDNSGGVIMSAAPNRFRFEVAAPSSSITYRLTAGSSVASSAASFHLYKNASVARLYNDNVFHILESVSGNTNPGSPTPISATPYFDGAAISPKNFEAASGGGNISIGTLGTGITTNNLFTGDIAEIIVYDRMLTNEERLEVQNYLKKKYDLKQV